MGNTAARLRNQIQERDSGAVVTARFRTGITHRLSEGRNHSAATIGPIHYWDDAGEVHEIDTALVEVEPDVWESADTEFRVTVRRNGNRRVYPRKGHSEYIEFDAPQYRRNVSSGPWNNFDWTTEGAIEDNRITWDGPDGSLIVKVQPTGVKVDIVLKHSGVNRPLRWPVRVSGLQYNEAEHSLVSGSDGATVLYLQDPFVLDASGERAEIEWSFGGNHVTYSPVDDTGLVYPLTIDPTVDSFNIAASADDGVWEPNGVTFSTTPTLMGLGQTFGAGTETSMFHTYHGVAIPSGATINDAYIEHTARDNNSETPMDVLVRAHDADDPAAPTTWSEADTAPRTTANTFWAVPSITFNTTFQTPDISAVIQELVDRAGWASGNSIVVFHDLDDWGTNVRRDIYGYHHDSAKASVLHIEWEDSAGPIVEAVRANGTGTAFAPVVTTERNTTIESVRAEGTGTAFVPAVTARQTAVVAGVLATGTGQAFPATVTGIGQVTISADLATATGTALAPSITTQANVTLSPPVASATGSALAPEIVTRTTVDSVTVTATGTAYSPVIAVTKTISIEAITASAAGQAFPPDVHIPLMLPYQGAIDTRGASGHVTAPARASGQVGTAGYRGRVTTTG